MQCASQTAKPGASIAVKSKDLCINRAGLGESVRDLHYEMSDGLGFWQGLKSSL